jgi:hypothetical protein
VWLSLSAASQAAVWAESQVLGPLAWIGCDVGDQP